MCNVYVIFPKHYSNINITQILFRSRVVSLIISRTPNNVTGFQGISGCVGVVETIILTQGVLQVFKSTMHYWYIGVSYEFRSPFLGCTASNINTSSLSTLDKVLFILLYVCEVLLPALPAAAFTVATVIHLYKTDKTLRSDRFSITSQRISTIITTPLGPLDGGNCAITHEQDSMSLKLFSWHKKRRATITILILITTYFALNIWFWLLTVADAVWIFSEGRIDYTKIWKGDWTSYYMTYYVIYIHTVVLNSVANGVIYFTRLQELQRYAKKLVVNCFRFGTKLEGNRRNWFFNQN